VGVAVGAAGVDAVGPDGDLDPGLGRVGGVKPVTSSTALVGASKTASGAMVAVLDERLKRAMLDAWK